LAVTSARVARATDGPSTIVWTEVLNFDRARCTRPTAMALAYSTGCVTAPASCASVWAEALRTVVADPRQPTAADHGCVIARTMEAALVLAVTRGHRRNSSEGQGTTRTAPTAIIIADAVLGHRGLLFFNRSSAVSGRTTNQQCHWLIGFGFCWKGMTCEHSSGVGAGTSIVRIIGASGHDGGTCSTVVEGVHSGTRVVVAAAASGSSLLAGSGCQQVARVIRQRRTSVAVTDRAVLAASHHGAKVGLQGELA
jgi:hypothetical protein